MITKKSKQWINRACKLEFSGNRLVCDDILQMGIKTRVINRWKKYIEKTKKI